MMKTRLQHRRQWLVYIVGAKLISDLVSLVLVTNILRSRRIWRCSEAPHQ